MSYFSNPPVKPENLAALNPYITLTGKASAGRSKDVTYQNTESVPEYSILYGHQISIYLSQDGVNFLGIYFRTGDYGAANVVVPPGWYVKATGDNFYGWDILEFDV